MKYTKLTCCRICKSSDISLTLSLGEQYLTGVFPKDATQKITKGPLDLGLCNNCGLLQLMHSYDLDELYGDNYGYRSGLNASMVQHLQQKIKKLELFINPNDGDLVIDIGSNDATSLKAYSSNLRRIGIDPTGLKFKQYYNNKITLIPEFFSKKAFFNNVKDQKAKIITSIACFYDLEDPQIFVQDIEACLEIDGIWHFEQSYMPSMLRTNAYDTLCHEHLEFYSLNVVKNLLDQNGLKVVDVEMNSINGGSFAVTAAKKNSSIKPNLAVIDWLLNMEEEMELSNTKPYLEFAERVVKHRNNFNALIESLVKSGKKVLGYGASTKGNVVLQFCGLTRDLIPAIADVNPDKYGSFTPGTNIPIISEEEARAMNPDYFVVFPWHFKHGILEREKEFINNGGKFIFPLPEIEIV
jgi:hypothetical protein